MADNRLQRLRFTAGFLLSIVGRLFHRDAARARPEPAHELDAEALIEAIMTGDTTALDENGRDLVLARDPDGRSWFHVALETGSLSAVQWFLHNGASPTAADELGRLPLEVLAQRAELADDLDDHLPDVEQMVSAVLAAGADPEATTLTGQRLSALLRDLGLPAG